MKKRWIALTLIFALLFAGCSASSTPQLVQRGGAAGSAPAATSAPAAAPVPAAQEKGKEDFGLGDSADESAAVQNAAQSEEQYGGHKVIKSASLSLETREFDSVLAHIKQKAADMGGYLASSNVSGRKPENYNDPGRYASLSVRIPQEKMDLFLSDARGAATVVSENSSGEDITSSYFDTDSRLKIYEAQRGRIEALLEKATTMEDIIKLETELSRLTYEIENLTTQLKRWDNLVDYSTVNIELSEIPAAKPVASNDSVGTRISEGLSATLSGIAVLFENLFVFVVVALPVLLILAAIAVAVVLLTRSGRKKRAAKQAQPPASSYGYPPASPQPGNEEEKKQ